MKSKSPQCSIDITVKIGLEALKQQHNIVTMGSIAQPKGFLRVQGSEVVDGDGNKIILKGVRTSHASECVASTNSSSLQCATGGQTK
jgi:hypothetical protein